MCWNPETDLSRDTQALPSDSAHVASLRGLTLARNLGAAFAPVLAVLGEAPSSPAQMDLFERP
ncbi:MAG: hypothetical protein N3D11_01835 [Candidatus Sumerlaeia bacterium]|nr:hypothetical protein [Candidatus Sumerlaeia bacterium]